MSEKTLTAALAAAQAEMQNATLNRVNSHFKNKYADLAAIREAVIPVLAKHGIAVTQTTDLRDGTLLLVTTLHFGAERIDSILPVPNNGNMQQFGSALTYARRYSLAAMAGVSAEEDDDGNAAAVMPKRAAAVQQAVRAAQASADGVIPVPPTADGQGSDWGAWGKMLAERLRAQKALEPFEALIRANTAAIGRVATERPKLHARVLEVIGDTRKALSEAPAAA